MVEIRADRLVLGGSPAIDPPSHSHAERRMFARVCRRTCPGRPPESLSRFFVRKTVFMKYCRASVVLPGGCGTMDELFEALTLGGGQQDHPVPRVVLAGSAC